MGFHAAFGAAHGARRLADIESFPDAQQEGLLLAQRQALERRLQRGQRAPVRRLRFRIGTGAVRQVEQRILVRILVAREPHAPARPHPCPTVPVVDAALQDVYGTAAPIPPPAGRRSAGPSSAWHPARYRAPPRRRGSPGARSRRRAARRRPETGPGLVWRPASISSRDEWRRPVARCACHRPGPARAADAARAARPRAPAYFRRTRSAGPAVSGHACGAGGTPMFPGKDATSYITSCRGAG